MVEIGMTIRQCVEHANLMPTMGSLQQVTEAKALRNKFVDRFSQAQLDAYGITKEELTGRYFVSDEKANTGVLVKFEDEEIKYFQNFISTLDKLKMVSIGNVELYKKVNSFSPIVDEIPQEEEQPNDGFDE